MIGATVPRLTDIEDDVSLLVQRQYEENPYPRWVKVPPSRKADGIEAYLHQTFPLAVFDRSPTSSRMEVLVAGCGTGQQSIRASQQFPTARILAVDLSRSSLAYAIRKTRELSVSSIEYAQADLLKLGSLDGQFDVITAGGVLHHLADPWTGWRTLCPCFVPAVSCCSAFTAGSRGGMCSGTEVHRRTGLWADGGRDTPMASRLDELRQRRWIGRRPPLGPVHDQQFPRSAFPPSGASGHADRDREFLQENNLAFLGFDISPDILQAYRTRFPDDLAATNLAQWQLFETENPDTFVGMYQFWIEKSR